MINPLCLALEMRCSACQVEIAEDVKGHYASEVHKINVKRQIHNAPPITIEEINGDQQSDDLSLEINGLEDDEEMLQRRPKRKSSSRQKDHSFKAICMFCDFPESDTHYRSHGLSDEEIAYINGRVCYVCYEGFSDREDLGRHISSGKHRNVLTDGVNLILENGKVIQGRARTRVREEEPVQRPERPRAGALVRRALREDKRAISKSKNQLKISLSMNNQADFRPDWMQ